MHFDKDELVAILQKNRGEHRAIFEEALEGYKVKVVEALEAHLERIKRGETIHVYVSFPQPADHTKDYDRLLKMLEMSVDQEIQLTEAQFAQYVQDDWDWMRQFLTTNSAYSKLATDKLSEG